MNAGFGSWLLGMSSVGALGGMLGMAIAIFIVLAATTLGSALLYAISGFGFAVLAAPLFLLFLDPAPAIQLVIIIRRCYRLSCFGGCCRLSGQPGQRTHWTALAMSPGRDLAAGADLAAACRGGGEDRARDAPRVLRTLIRGDARLPCCDDPHPCPDLACCRHPDPLRLSRRPRWPSNR